jgi:hypothetical protein
MKGCANLWINFLEFVNNIQLIQIFLLMMENLCVFKSKFQDGWGSLPERQQAVLMCSLEEKRLLDLATFFSFFLAIYFTSICLSTGPSAKNRKSQNSKLNRTFEQRKSSHRGGKNNTFKRVRRNQKYSENNFKCCPFTSSLLYLFTIVRRIHVIKGL